MRVNDKFLEEQLQKLIKKILAQVSICDGMYSFVSSQRQYGATARIPLITIDPKVQEQIAQIAKTSFNKSSIGSRFVWKTEIKTMAWGLILFFELSLCPRLTEDSAELLTLVQLENTI